MAVPEERRDFISLPVLYDTWPKLRSDLNLLANRSIQGVEGLEEVLQRNDRWDNVEVPMALLRKALKQEEVCTLGHFCKVLLPWIAKTALHIEDLFKDAEYKVQNLYTGRESEIVLTRRQICCFLCLAFFNSFEPQQGNYQHFTLSDYFSFTKSKSQQGKLLCVLNYFERIRKSEEANEEDYLSMCVSVSRRSLDPGDAKGEVWKECGKPLLSFESLGKKTIENAHGCLQVDFADEYIGGNVLGMGCVQEEIRFVINPECLVCILFCEAMTELESILIVGAEQFSIYTGYDGEFTYAGPYVDTNPVDDRQQRTVSIVAIDAMPFRYLGADRQFEKHGILRELNKAYCGFTNMAAGDDFAAQRLIPVATGNWGCGAFGGKKPLKTLVQWMAASRAGRSIKYSTFRDTELSERQAQLTGKLLGRGMTVGELYRILLSYRKTGDLFDYVISAV